MLFRWVLRAMMTLQLNVSKRAGERCHRRAAIEQRKGIVKRGPILRTSPLVKHRSIAAARLGHLLVDGKRLFQH